MTYSDTFNFEDHPNVDNPAEPNPDGDEEARNFQAAIVRNTITLYASPFESEKRGAHVRGNLGKPVAGASVAS
jgi:hypothetical protein